MLDGFRKLSMRQRCLAALLCCALAFAGVETSLFSTAVAKDGGGNSDGGGRGNDGGGRGGDGNSGRGENDGGRGQGGGGPGNSDGGRGGEGNSGRGGGTDSGSAQGASSEDGGHNGGARGGSGSVGRGAEDGGRSAGGRSGAQVGPGGRMGGPASGGGALGSGWGTTSPERAREAVSQGWALPLSTVLPTVARYAPGQLLEVDLRQTWNGEWRYEFLVLTKDRRYHEVFVDAQRNQVVQIRRR
jgi:hypothetical protein